jgi:glycosyltransferase involved in cell wall biosynthesis
VKVGIDLTSLGREYGGGKEQFIINLIQGFVENGQLDELVLLVYEEHSSRMLKMFPEATLALVPENFSFLNKLVLRNLATRTFSYSKLVKKEKLEMIFFPSGYTGFKRLPIPTVVNTHDIQFIEYPRRTNFRTRWKDRWLYRCDFSLRDRIIAISQYDQGVIERHYPNQKDKIVRIYNPIVFCDKSWSPNNQEPYILAVNIGFAHKNTETLIQAYSTLTEKIPHDLVLVGKLRKETEYLKSIIENSSARERIHLTGHISQEELDDLYGGCSLFVTPSLYEGFGMPPVEALGRGIPVISSEETALPESTMGRATYYKPARDHKALATAIQSVLLKKIDHEYLGKSIELMVSNYSCTKIASVYMEFFQSLIQESK